MTTDRQDEEDTSEEPAAESDRLETTASGSYKVLGEFTAASGAGVLGRNTAGSGTPIGVEGAVPNSSSGYGLSTPDGARIAGTAELGGLAGTLTNNTTVTDIVGPGLTVNSGALGLPTTASDGHVLAWDGSSWTTGFPGTRGSSATFELLAGGNTALRLEPTTAGDPNVIGGDSSNQVSSDSSGAFVGGGEQNSGNGDWTTIGGGIDNTTSGARTAVVGGKANAAADLNAFVGGGKNNTAEAPAAALVGGTSNAVTGWEGAVGGGQGNTAGGKGAAVPGGRNNTADGNYSFAGGRAADTNGYAGAFVWGGSGSTVTTASDAAQVVFDATGGFIIEGNATVQGRAEISTLGGSLTGGTDVTDIAGSGLTISSGALTVSESKPSVSDDGTQVLSAPEDLDFGSNLAVTDDGDTTVTVDATGIGLDVEDDGAAVLSNTTGLDFGTGLTAADNGDGTATVYIPNTFTDVADDGTRIVTDVEEIDFASNLSVSDDGDGTVTVAASGTSPWNDDDGDSLLEPGSGFEGIDVTGVSSGRVLTPRIDTAGSDLQLVAGPTGASDATNVVVGNASNATTSGVVGATISGGGFDDGAIDDSHRVGGDYATVGGGRNNAVSSGAKYATVGGGLDNTASGRRATVAGGTSNSVTEFAATVGGGYQNTASDNRATVAGGRNNEAAQFGSTVGGGTDNAARDSDATVAGGTSNAATGNTATVGGGYKNTASDSYATVAGGTDNTVSGSESTLGGGSGNTVTGRWSTIAGGTGNSVDGDTSSVGGGSSNTLNENRSTVGGGHSNEVLSGAKYATVGGGRKNEVGGEYGTIAGGGPSDPGQLDSTNNVVTDDFGTIGGGGNNQAGDASGSYSTFATVAGGLGNVASATYATVGGGTKNEATQAGGMIPGGFANEAGQYSFAAGSKAKALESGTFVWSDVSTDSSGNLTEFSASVGPGPTGSSTFHVRSTNGARFVTDVDSNGDPSTGVKLASGGGGWNSLSSRTVKRDQRPVDTRALLERLRDVEVSTWRYVSQEGVRHIGPMAEAFHEAFEVGEDAETINTVDADGVAFAAIQGLAEKHDELAAENDRLAEELAAKDQRIEALTSTVETLREDRDRLRSVTESLREQVDALEDRLTRIEDTGASAASADD